jgi:hypothetical protein
VHYHRQRRRDKVSVISGISVSPQRQRLGLYDQLYFDNIGQEEVCMFLRGLLRHLRGPVLVLLDNFSDNVAACISSTFPPMLRSSTPMKGVVASQTYPRQ